MKPILYLGMALLFVSLALAPPPSLTDFQQFFGTITNLPEGNAIIQAKIGSMVNAEQPVVDGVYGRSPAFKVAGSAGSTITFIILLNGVETIVGTHPYEQNHITELNLVYPVVQPVVNETNTSQEESNQNTTSQKKKRIRREADDTPPPPLPQGTCLQSWQCSLWSSCSADAQIRTCYQVDNCNALLAAGQAREVITTPKPMERKTCESSASESVQPQSICPTGSKRCQGDELQFCTGDVWTTLQQCDSCNSLTLTCAEELPPAVRKPASTWPYFVGGSLLVLAVILVLGFFIYQQKKYGPVKGYIRNARSKGANESQLRSRLLQQGWSYDDVEKLLK